MNDKTPINKNVIYAYAVPDFKEQADNIIGKEESNYILKIKQWSDLEAESFMKFSPRKMWKASSIQVDLETDSGKKLNEAITKFKEYFMKGIPHKYYNQHLDECKPYLNSLIYHLKDNDVLFDSDIEKIDTEFHEKYNSYLKELPFIYENMIQDANAKEPNAHFLSVDELNKLRESNKIQFLNVDKFEAGQVFIKHPFLPNTYMSIETSETTLFHIKMQCLSRIMQCLGATSVRGHAYVSETKQRNMDADGHVSYKVVDATGSLSTSQNEKYESDYVLEDTFSGDFTEESYAEALEEAKKVGLYNDFDIKNLLEQRNPNKKNEMKSRKVKIEMTRELNKSLDSAFALQAEGFGMNGTYKEILETQRNVMFELNITF